MPRYHVIAREVQYYQVEVEAPDEEAAKEMGSEMDGPDFEYLDGGDWEIIDAQLVPPPKPDFKKQQQTLF